MRKIVRTELTIHSMTEEGRMVHYGIAFFYEDGGSSRIGSTAAVGEKEIFHTEDMGSDLPAMETENHD